VTISVSLATQGIGQWTFRRSDEAEWLPARVPGCVHTDLKANGRIPDPFHGANELSLQWIDKHDWEYAAAFDVPAELMAQSKVELVFDGLDTFAEVSLNGAFVLRPTICSAGGGRTFGPF
jgi:beta-mannosidase